MPLCRSKTVNEIILQALNVHYNGQIITTSELFVDAEKSPRNLKRSAFKKYMNIFGSQKNTVDRSKQIVSLRSRFAKSLKELISSINSSIDKKNISLEKVGYVFCLEEKIMNALNIDSKTDLLRFVKESNLVDFQSHPRRMIIVDQGDKEVWDMMQRNQLESTSFYVQSHISDECIYLKLYQVVDVTDTNGNILEQSTVFVKEKVLVTKNLYEQVSVMLWRHLQSLQPTNKRLIINPCDEDLPDYLGNYEQFEENLIFFLKNQVKSDT